MSSNLDNSNLQEQKKAKEELFGRLKPLPYEVYQDIYKNCGLHVDDRRQKLQDCARNCEKEVISYLDFARCLPEFHSLSLDDRIILVRGKKFIIIL